MSIDHTTYRDIGNGIRCIDTGLYRSRHAACYLIQSGDEAAFIDTGTSHTVPRLLALLDELGVARRQVRYVIPTHVHLDHGGGAGALMAELPEARLVVHPKGAPHMIDPQKLRAGALAVYGEREFEAHFGAIVPVPEDRVVAADDGATFPLGRRRLEFLDTPGHANHHGCLFDDETRGFFTGDTFGVAYPDVAAGDARLVFAPTTPVAFDPEGWRRSLDRLMSYRPAVMYVTHFGPIHDVGRHAAELRRSIADHEALALEEEGRDGEDRPQRLTTAVRHLLRERARDHGIRLDATDEEALLGVDIQLNAQGLEVWLQRRARAASAAGAS
ncbi:MAG: MBL fold metallo-hydrolase [Gammaproteobacteria bacterium]|nr:MBL fold metallo-hydrolase [Gammaproteobacteria bacterium]